MVDGRVRDDSHVELFPAARLDVFPGVLAVVVEPDFVELRGEFAVDRAAAEEVDVSVDVGQGVAGERWRVGFRRGATEGPTFPPDVERPQLVR